MRSRKRKRCLAFSYLDPRGLLLCANEDDFKRTIRKLTERIHRAYPRRVAAKDPAPSTPAGYSQLETAAVTSPASTLARPPALYSEMLPHAHGNFARLVRAHFGAPEDWIAHHVQAFARFRRT